MFVAHNIYGAVPALHGQSQFEDVRWSTADESEDIEHFEDFDEVFSFSLKNIIK